MLFATQDLHPDDPKRKDLGYAERAAEHVVYITRHLLNFSRKQMIEREVLDPWPVLMAMQTLLARLLGAGIHVNVVRKGETGSVDVDAGQLAEVFINLALNARYAMGLTGTFEVMLSAVEVDERADAAFPGQTAGRYVRFQVRDTGTGMDEDTPQRAFEPFFTTKPVGEGTGLGLASVFGAVTQNGGFVRVDSRLGEGTTFTIDLPEVAAANGLGQEPASTHDLPTGSETIIVADDQDGVRSWISRVLRERGYSVLEAGHGAEALRRYAAHAATVRLVLTDLVMPGTGGRAVGEGLAALAPHVPVLYMSAYTEDEILRRQLLAPASAFLQKPFSALQLAQRVRAALDSASRPRGQARGSETPTG